MAEGTKDNGLTITWTALASILGKMVATTKVNTKTIRNMGTEFIHGPITDAIGAIGVKASSMELEPILYLNKILSMVYGKKASALNGSRMIKLSRSRQVS